MAADTNGITLLPFQGVGIHICLIPKAMPWAVRSLPLQGVALLQTGNAIDTCYMYAVIPAVSDEWKTAVKAYTSFLIVCLS